jgi:hypothetical protein
MTNTNPLQTIASQIYILSLPIFPKRTERILQHLRDDCHFPESQITFHQGSVRNNITTTRRNSAENNEISILDCLTINENLMDDVSDNIFENHVGMIRKAYETSSKSSWVLFLEDDARFDKEVFSNTQACSIKEFMDSHKDKPAVLLLGVFPYFKPFGMPITTYYHPHILRHHTMTLCAHSYFLTRKAMERILQYTEMREQNRLPKNFPRRIHFDMLFYYLNLDVYSSFPMVCFQNKDPAIYQRFQVMVPLFDFFSFRKISQIVLYLSILLPILFLLIFLFTTSILLLHTYRTYQTYRSYQTHQTIQSKKKT